MIKFFRQIRQRLLTENPPAGRAGKFSKYLLYAKDKFIVEVIWEIKQDEIIGKGQLKEIA